MFDAARAVLMQLGQSNAAQAKTHQGLMATFSQHLIKPGLLQPEMGKLFKHAEEARLLADYQGNPIEAADAQRIVDDAQRFLAAIEQILST
jgi:uncharacterized protein (UPF0332 family)